MNTDISIFIGPKRTGTTWLYSVLHGQTVDKEIRYPIRFGRQYVYKRYVENKTLLIWPYLIHEYDCMVSLLDDLKKRGVTPKLYVTDRDFKEHRISLETLLRKQGAKNITISKSVEGAFIEVQNNLEKLTENWDITAVSIIEAKEEDFRILANACNVSVELLKSRSSEIVNASKEVSRLEGVNLIKWFFMIKPFLPTWLQSVTRIPLLRLIFLRKYPK